LRRLDRRRRPEPVEELLQCQGRGIDETGRTGGGGVLDMPTLAHHNLDYSLRCLSWWQRGGRGSVCTHMERDDSLEPLETEVLSPPATQALHVCLLQLLKKLSIRPSPFNCKPMTPAPAALASVNGK